jgi:hypothetical protein
MAENMSLADQAVAALAAVVAMDAGMDMSHPERHSIRTLKRLAEARMSQAFREAQELAYMATDLTSLVDNVRKEYGESLLQARPVEHYPV